MPVYSYACKACGETTDHQVPYKDREKSQDCRVCETKTAKYVCVRGKITTTMNAVRKRKDDGRMIFDEREVHAGSEHGENWRDEGTNRRPGGAYATEKKIFHK